MGDDKMPRCFNCKYWHETEVKHGGFLMGKCDIENIETVNIGYCLSHFPKETNQGED